MFLAEWREAQIPPLSQEQLGERIEPPVDKGTVSRWEKAARAGKISTAIVAAYAEALRRSAKEMYDPPRKNRPSLDHLAGDLDDEAYRKVVEDIEFLRKRRA